VLSDYGLDDRVRALASEAVGSCTNGTADIPELGRVARIDRGSYTVVTETATRRVPLSTPLRETPEPEMRPAIGDWVLVIDDTVGAVLDRRSAFRRGDAERLQAQVVAANVDTVFVVHDNADVNARRLERELALAWESGALPVIVLTKSDLVDDPAAGIDAATAAAPGLDVVVTSAVTGLGIETLATFARPARTVAFIGASGVGKSSLVNALLGQDAQAIGAVRDSDGRGRHTTSHRELFLLPGGGVLVDTPGLRTIGMWQSDDGIARVFPDIEALAGGCRFRDCAHDREPDCAVRAAVDAGTLDPARLRNYREMLAELDHLDRESEVRARLERKRHAKILSRAIRNLPKRPT
jgi:ribosome biogenesis GTPase